MEILFPHICFGGTLMKVLTYSPYTTWHTNTSKGYLFMSEVGSARTGRNYSSLRPFTGTTW